ncbi:GNAT family N-acetyltransferase [Celeribacter marinus]|uniref:GNAT family N-acetyltransferase n=1 Tax=Celeribacter marinus TaxID=1397108 RepID=UPI003F6D732F
MRQAPTITTARLTLRPHVARDFDAYADIFASDRAGYMGQLKRRQAWFSFCSDVAQWSLFGYGAWGVERTDDGVFLGQVALLKPDHFPELELGWMMTPDGEGHGYAFEAAQAARDFAYVELGQETLVSYISPANTRSIALAMRLGAAHDESAALPDGESPAETIVYRHPDPAALQDGGMEAYA